LAKIGVYCQILVQTPNTKFNEITPHGSRAVSCRRKEGLTDVTSLIVAFRSCFANAPIDDDGDDDDDDDDDGNNR